MRVRKQFNELTTNDFAEYPVWEFALDEECEEGQDETTVRPYSFTPPLNARAGMFVVSAAFVLADGTRMSGCVFTSVPEEASIGHMDPAILTSKGAVSFWFGAKAPTAQEIADSYQLLGKTASEVFPLVFDAEVSLEEGVASGVIEGFLFKCEETRGFLRKKQTVVKMVK